MDTQPYITTNNAQAELGERVILTRRALPFSLIQDPDEATAAVAAELGVTPAEAVAARREFYAAARAAK